jgi:hypothetical protein
MPAPWISRFEVKPGRWVFVPSEESRSIGLELRTDLASIWDPPRFFYHLRSGGHVAALRAHLGNSVFVHLDIEDFFGCVSKTRITRCLKPLVGYEKARQIARESVVFHPTDKSRLMVPYGFVQSQLLASICLADSALGRYMTHLSESARAAISVYVDDIIISTRDSRVAHEIHAEIQNAAKRAHFRLRPKGNQVPSLEIRAFNIMLRENSMLVAGDRMIDFVTALRSSSSDAQKQGIVSYVETICPTQAQSLDDAS